MGVIDREFSVRLRGLLKQKGLSQQRFANETLLSRAAITKWLARESEPSTRSLAVICSYFRVSERWLAEGIGDPERGYRSDRTAELYDKYRERSSERSAAEMEFQKGASRAASVASEALRESAEEIISEYQRLARETAGASIDFTAKARTAKAVTASLQETFSSRIVDLILETGQIFALQKSDVGLESPQMGMIPQTVGDLLDVVRQATSAPGAKVAFSREIGIRPQHLSAWLSGKYQPSGEAVLKMLPRVLAFSAQSLKQKKAPKVESTPSKPKARKRKSTTK